MKGDLSKKLTLVFICLIVMMFVIGMGSNQNKPVAEEIENSKVPVNVEKPVVEYPLRNSEYIKKPVDIEKLKQDPEPEPGVKFIYDPVIARYSKYTTEPVNIKGTGKYKKYIFITIYDKFFKKYTKMYFGYGFDYLWFKAQAVAESNLAMGGTNEKIRSHVGAQGIMQIMPGTWREIINRKMNKYIKGHSVFDAEYNIAAGIYYNRNMGQIWKARRTFLDWMSFIFASYNAGAGNIMKAQKYVTSNPNVWENVAAVLHLVTGRHSKETIGYVKRIILIRGDF